MKFLFLMGRRIKQAIWTFSIITCYQQSFGIIWQLGHMKNLEFVKIRQKFCSNFCQCYVCVMADDSASNCTGFTIVDGQISQNSVLHWAESCRWSFHQIQNFLIYFVIVSSLQRKFFSNDSPSQKLLKCLEVFSKWWFEQLPNWWDGSFCRWSFRP